MVVPPPPSDWSFSKAEVVSPLDQGLSQGMGWVSPITQGVGLVWSLPHQTQSSQAQSSSPPQCFTWELYLVPGLSLLPAEPTPL